MVTGIMFLLGVIPGMPHFVFLLLAAATGGLAYLAVKRSKQKDLPEDIDFSFASTKASSICLDINF